MTVQIHELVIRAEVVQKSGGEPSRPAPAASPPPPDSPIRQKIWKENKNRRER